MTFVRWLPVRRVASRALGGISFGVSGLLAGCAAAPGAVPGEGRDTPLPTATEVEVGLPPGVWQDLLNELEARRMPVDQIGVLVDGRLIGAKHYGGHSSTTLHDLRSATKPVTSLLLGIAIDRGLIDNVDAPIDRFFPEFTAHPSRGAFAPLTLRHLVTHRSGLDCTDWRDSPGNEERMYRTGDWARFFYGIPAVAEPGSRFSYCTAAVVMLGEVIARAAGRPLPDFARERLFEPLGIHEARWADAGAGITDAGGHLHLSLESLLKLGELTRTNGVWRGRRIVSATWIADSMAPAGDIDAPRIQARMGRLWWLEPVRDGVARSWQARGNGGQLVMVVPEFKLVVAATGRAYNAAPEVQWAPFSLVQRWLIPALTGRALPEGTPSRGAALPR